MTAVRAVIQHNQKILFVQRSVASRRPLQWCLPGGKTRPNESTIVACAREVFEEVGLTVSVGRFLCSADGQDYFLCEVMQNSGDDVVLQSEECADFRWLNSAEILSVGELMDLRAVCTAFRNAGLQAPEIESPVK